MTMKIFLHLRWARVRGRTNGTVGRGGGNDLLKFSFLSDFVVVLTLSKKIRVNAL